LPHLPFLFGLSFHGNLRDKKSLVLLQGSNVADMVFVAEFNDRAHRVILTVLLQEGRERPRNREEQGEEYIKGVSEKWVINHVQN